MQKKLTIALDIDGTLIDKTGKLDQNVLSLFRKADLNRTTFILSTACSYSQAKGTIKLINEELKDKKIKPWIITSCGSCIYDPNGKKIEQQNLNPSFVEKCDQIVSEIDPDAVVIYRNNENNYYTERKYSLKTIAAMKAYFLLESKKGDTGMQFTKLSKNKINEMKKDGVQNLFIASLDSKLKQKIYSKLKSLIKDYEYQKVYGGFAIQAPARPKEHGINEILYITNLKTYENITIEHNHKFDNTMTEKLEDVVYFGDGANDVTMLKTAKYSFARGKKAKTDAVKNAKFHYNNLDTVADALFGDENKFEARMKKLPITDIKNSIKNKTNESTLFM